MRTKGHALARLLLPLIAAAVIMWFFTALGSLNEGQLEQGRARLELSLRRAAAAEYAVSGEYPATLEQLVERSGIQIDAEHYAVFYDAFASNLMPDITVLVKET